MTSLAIVLSPDASKRARKLHGWGYALIVFAFALPFLAAGLGRSTAFRAGESLVRNLMALFVLALVAWLATRRRGDMAKAVARLLTGVLMVVFVGGSLALAANEEQQVKQQMQGMLAFAAKQSERFADLGRRFDRVDLNGVLTVENLTSPSGIATGKALVAQYRALLAERRSLLSSYLSDYERYVSALPNGDFKAGVMSSIEANKTATVKLYADLDVAQTAWVDSISAVLDWAGTQAGKLSMKAGQLMFTSPTQQAELSALANNVNTREASLNKVLQATAAAQAAAQEKTKANLQEADKLLKK